MMRFNFFSLMFVLTLAMAVVPQAEAKVIKSRRPVTNSSPKHATTGNATSRAEEALRHLVSTDKDEVSIQALSQAFAQIPRSDADGSDYLSMPACQIFHKARNPNYASRGKPILITGLERWTAQQGFKLLDAPFLCFLSDTTLIKSQDPAYADYQETEAETAFRYRFRAEDVKIKKEIFRLATERLKASDNATDFWLAFNWRRLFWTNQDSSQVSALADLAAQVLIDREARGLSLAGYLGIDGEKFEPSRGRVDGGSYSDRNLDGLFAFVRKDLKLPLLRVITRALTRDPNTEWANIHFGQILHSMQGQELTSDDWEAAKKQLLVQPDGKKPDDFGPTLYRVLGKATATESEFREIARFVGACDRDPYFGGRSHSTNAWPLGYALLESPLAEEPAIKQILVTHFNKFDGSLDPTTESIPLRALSSSAQARLTKLTEESLSESEFTSLAEKKNWSTRSGVINFPLKLLLNNITSLSRFDQLAERVYTPARPGSYAQSPQWLQLKQLGSVWNAARIDEQVRGEITSKLTARIASRMGGMITALKTASAAALNGSDFQLLDSATSVSDWHSLLVDMSSLRELSSGRTPFIASDFQLLRAGVDASIASKVSASANIQDKLKLAIAAGLATTSALTTLADQNLNAVEFATLIKYAISPRVLNPSLGYFFVFSILGRSPTLSPDAVKFFATVQPDPKDAARMCQLLGFALCEREDLQKWYTRTSIQLQATGYQLPVVDVSAFK